MKQEVNIRKMRVADIDAVMYVEKESFATAWSEEIFKQELVENPYGHYFIIECNGEIVGYVGIWIVFDDAQITNIAILPSQRGRKLGEQLFRHVFKYALIYGVRRLSLEVRKSNIVAQKLYRKFGLVAGGIRKQYYTDNQEDAIVMWVNINE
ncbi:MULTISPECIES: ribosomal protein S18-alanine N-acetyltransferase [Virgibacillus]|nr:MULTISPECIES: ribosomal protein S18-alanine N-acetyltransferase [Virgibacillus]NWO14868.1 ribosomal protein S18-alanine N-acetyltransferase [Virgibacillus sp.]